MATEYMLAASFDPVEVGRETGFYPVHVKVLPWFRSEACAHEISKQLQAVADNCEPFIVEGEGEAWLSEHSNHRVRYIGERGLLLSVHLQFSDVLHAFGGEFVKPQYTGEAFQPHVSPQLTGRKWIRRGEQLPVRGLELIAHKGGGLVPEHHIDLRAAS